jgi:iron complex transport system substrate-binding protein
MSRLVSDAGGEILGSEPGAESSSISVEEAYRLSSDADFWLNAGWCRTKEELSSCDPMFKNFDIPLVYNNIARATPGGGNDFWESGAVRPDLILEDLCNIFQGNDASLHYYLEVK